jgi:hypothetical protein
MDSFKIINGRQGTKFIKFIKSVNLISAVIGGSLGYLFYFSTSCCSDEMIISLNPYLTVIYGFVTGALISVKRK